MSSKLTAHYYNYIILCMNSTLVCDSEHSIWAKYADAMFVYYCGHENALISLFHPFRTDLCYVNRCVRGHVKYVHGNANLGGQHPLNGAVGHGHGLPKRHITMNESHISSLSSTSHGAVGVNVPISWF